MKTILPVLIIAIIGASCATDHVSVPESQTQAWSAQMGGLSWLAHQQRPDGYWGNNEHRVALTSLATLAFLSHGETPASPKYGEAVENGLRALLQVSNNSPDLSPSDRALITWCLAETYGMTRIPTVLNSARTHASDSISLNPIYLPDGRERVGRLEQDVFSRVGELPAQKGELWVVVPEEPWD